MIKVVIDSGHGGSDSGTVYQGRQEKDDNLRLALAVGKKLQSMNIDVVYTKTEDIDQSVSQKAAIANRAEADYFLSIHRNVCSEPNQYSGAEAEIYDHSGIKETMAGNIIKKLEETGYHNLGVQKCPNNEILRSIHLSAFILKAGCINSDKDNRLFDNFFDDTVQAIADGILETLNESLARGQQIEEDTEDEIFEGSECQKFDRRTDYRIQTGSFKILANAENLLYHLQKEGFPAYIIHDNDFYKVQVGVFVNLDDAVRMESMLRCFGYSTFLST